MKQVDLQQAEYLPPPEERPGERPQEKREARPGEKREARPQAPKKQKQDLTVQERVVTEKELIKWAEKDMDLTVPVCIEILCRLNTKDREYVREDIKRKRRLRIPKDFIAYKDWTPLPRTLAGVDHIPKCILIVRDIPFIGWYERGTLAGDSYVCIGRSKEWTKRGLFTIKEKDPDHMSDYPNAYGEPALMPFALKVYERVWIHAGDVIGPYCSHGCINVPIFTMAQKLYNWSEVGTTVIITDSLKSLSKDLPHNKPAKPVQTQPKGPPKNEAKKLNT